MDMPTLGTVVAATAVCLLVVLVLLYRQNRQYAGLGWWVLGQLLMVATFVISASANTLTWQPLVVFTTVGTVASLLAMYVGIVRFLGQPRPRVWPWVYLGVAIALIALFTWQGDVGLRRATMYLMLAGVQAMTVRALLVYRQDYAARSGAFMRVVFGIAAPYYALLGLASLLTLRAGERTLDLDGAPVFAWLGAIMLMVMWTYGLSLLVGEHLRYDLAEDRANLRQVFLTSPDATLICRLHDDVIHDVNDGFTRLFGFDRAEVEGRAVSGLWNDPAARQQMLHDALAGPVEGVETTMRTKDGDPIEVALSARLLGFGGEPYLVTVARDITEQKRWEAHLQEQASTDDLTGVLNRRAFLQRARLALTKCREQRQPLTVAIIDLDDFKSLNDSFGHATGDAAVRSFATAVSSVLREGDAVGRLGGDEFGVLLPATTVTHGRVVVERLRTTITERPLRLGDRLVPLSFSAGVASDEGCSSLDDLFAKADGGLYRAKALGRNRVVAA